MKYHEKEQIVGGLPDTIDSPRRKQISSEMRNKRVRRRRPPLSISSSRREAGNNMCARARLQAKWMDGYLANFTF